MVKVFVWFVSHVVIHEVVVVLANGSADLAAVCPILPDCAHTTRLEPDPRLSASTGCWLLLLLDLATQKFLPVGMCPCLAVRPFAALSMLGAIGVVVGTSPAVLLFVFPIAVAYYRVLKTYRKSATDVRPNCWRFWLG